MDISHFLHTYQLQNDAIARALAPILLGETGMTSTGYPYLPEATYQHLRDRVPQILHWGPQTLAAAQRIKNAAQDSGYFSDAKKEASFHRAHRVIQQVINTAAITAPSDLWLLRHVFGALRLTGLTERLLAGEIIDVNQTDVVLGGEKMPANPMELEADLTFLLSRGYLRQKSVGIFQAPECPHALAVLRDSQSLAPGLRATFSHDWAHLFAGKAPTEAIRQRITQLGAGPLPEKRHAPSWIASSAEIEVGFRLLPIILALRATRRIHPLLNLPALRAEDLLPQAPDLGAIARDTLAHAGLLHLDAGQWIWGPTAKRTLTRGPGPMGIIEAYHKYLEHLDEMMVHGRGTIWVTRSENIAASQDANRRTFQRANDALDRFCADTGFQLSVFIEHAIGRGEATRQRFSRPGGADLVYFGADLEDAAIDACLVEQKKGHLPANMAFVRQADIGKPQRLIEAIQKGGHQPEGAVMIVGNGFHEVRNQSDENMIAVFKAYCDAGIIMLFTEESALSVDDLLNTAWNTYHAGFKYMHEKSGQGLRPADEAPTPRLGRPLMASWHECATQAGYQRLDAYCFRSRTIYPTLPQDGHNPSISVSHFFVPDALAQRLLK